MLRKPFHGWSVKQEIQKLTAIRTPSPRQSPGTPTHPTPLPLSFSTARTFHPRLTFVLPSKPPHFLSLQARWATYYSRAPNPKLEVSPACEFHVEDKEAMKYGGKVIDGDRPEQETICLVRMSLWERTKLEASGLVYEVTSQDEVDRFYQEMSKEVETLLHERDRRTLPKELSRSVVVTCVTDGGMCDVFVLRTKQRSQESCRDIEVKSVTTYVQPQVTSHQYPGNLLERLRLKRNYKVVNKLEVSPGQESRVAFKEAMKYGGKVTLLRTWVIQPWEKIMIIVASLLLLKEMDLVEGPSKEPAISTIRMLSALCVAVPGVAILSGIYFGWKICWITFGN